MNKYNTCIVASISVIMICLVVIIMDMPIKIEQQQKSIDYSQYMNKTWVTENNLGYIGILGDMWSFTITKIENGLIEGDYGRVFERRMNSNHSYDKFSGSIAGDTAVCQFIGRPVSLGGDGDVSNVILRFRDDSQILVSVDPLNNVLESGDFLYRPYNIDCIDFEKMIKGKTLFPIDLDYGEDVSVVAMYMPTDSGTSPPYEYLINDNGDILFFFDMPSESNTELTAAVAEDFNGDGLKDIRLTESYIGREGQRDWLLYQTESGGFSQQ